MSLLVILTCKQQLETYLGVGRSKFRFWGEKWFKSVKNSAELITVRLSEPEASSKRTIATISSSLKRKIRRLSEMLSDSISYSAFLCLFHMFLF